MSIDLVRLQSIVGDIKSMNARHDELSEWLWSIVENADAALDAVLEGEGERVAHRSEEIARRRARLAQAAAEDFEDFDFVNAIESLQEIIDLETTR